MTDNIIEWTQQPEPLPTYPSRLNTTFHLLRGEIYRSPWLDKPYRLLTGQNTLRRLRAVYKLTDQITEYVAPSMVCQKGCAHCCHTDVPMTMIEALYISESIDIQPMSVVTQISGHHRRCPFLNHDNTCQIYEVRPFRCRTLFARYSSILCEHDVTTHRYSHQNSDILGDLYQMVLHLNGRQPVRDVRNFFNEVPEKE